MLKPPYEFIMVQNVIVKNCMVLTMFRIIQNRFLDNSSLAMYLQLQCDHTELADASCHVTSRTDPMGPQQIDVYRRFAHSCEVTPRTKLLYA